MISDIQWFRRMLAVALYGAGQTGLRMDALHVALQTKGFQSLSVPTLEAQLCFLAAAQRAEEVPNPLGGAPNWRLTTNGTQWVEQGGWV